MRSEVAGLSGGVKQKYNRQHHAEIKQYFYDHGPEATCQEFNLKADTLRGVLEREHYYYNTNKLSKADRWVFEAAMNGDRELKRRIRALEDWRVDSEPILEVGRGIIRTLAGNQSQSRQIEGGKDELDITNFVAKLEKRG